MTPRGQGGGNAKPLAAGNSTQPFATEAVPLLQELVTVQWRRSPRARRVSLRIDPRGGVVVVTLPPRAGRAAGMALLADHADWVRERLSALPGAVALVHGASIPIGGVEHRVRHVPDGRRGAWIENAEILVSGDAVFLPRRLGDFLRAEAKRRLFALVRQAAGAANLQPARVTLKDPRTRWGSCSPDRVLMFSWRLLMAPDFVQEYVVAHEVAHLRHMNHGPQFWALVRSLTPHTDAGTAWLRGNGARLLRVG